MARAQAASRWTPWTPSRPLTCSPPPRPLATGWPGLAELHIALAIAAAGLDEAIDAHTGILHP